MIKITVQNMQAIGSAEIEIDENSIVEFTGDNSNGKSIISKFIQGLTSGDLRHKDVRRTLIKDGYITGGMAFEHNNEQLVVCLAEELKDCVVLYSADKNEDKIYKIPLSDVDGVNKLIHKFGFRTYASGDICLQLSPTWGAIPFITTNGTVNRDIVKDITEDKVAEEFLKSFSTITFPIFKETIKNYKENRDKYKALLDNLEYYDWKAYETMANKLRSYANMLDKLTTIYIESIPVPDLNIIEVGNLKLNNVKLFEFYETIPKIQFDSELLRNYIDLANGKCPTCGRRFNGEGEYT